MLRRRDCRRNPGEYGHSGLPFFSHYEQFRPRPILARLLPAVDGLGHSQMDDGVHGPYYREDKIGGYDNQLRETAARSIDVAGH